MSWTTNQIRHTFLEFFKEKNHSVEASAPIVIKDDPTLMFTNAGMNQFKSVFVGNQKSTTSRIANSQKCLRVSGKHNDLEEVGRDHYHHTMFEMLGNWSFGDYFKQEAIDWSWELLVDVFKLDTERIYVSVFSGDDSLGLSEDKEARQLWQKHLKEDRILGFGRKENFWEMGDVGPCGPCSEIHFDMRPDAERKLVDGASLVNQDHPEVIEIWNLVFMQYDHKKSGELERLKDKFIDTGMGLERLSRVLQRVDSNYDIDVFQTLISRIEQVSGKKYSGSDSMSDVAFRVISDHIRAVAFCISDGQLPASTGAGYVIRRVLRRAIRFGYSYLNIDKPSLHLVAEELISAMGAYYTELSKSSELITKVVLEEERSFLSTLEKGLQRLDHLIESEDLKVISGDFAFELYDTYGFPIDLTCLIAEEQDLSVDIPAFEKNLEIQKSRSRAASKVDFDDWILVKDGDNSKFVGYDQLRTEASINKYRNIKVKGKELTQIVLSKTPFYPEGGGQLGDRGIIEIDGVEHRVLDTKKENDEIVHFIDSIKNPIENDEVGAEVDSKWRQEIIKNHSATHLLHHALREELGAHVEQKGSLVSPEKLRFDFSHFEKISEVEMNRIQQKVIEKISESIELKEHRKTPISKAKEMGAMALFGEKYGDEVRVIQFDDSIELCGGTHVQNTAEIDGFSILAESSVASGIRRIEAITGAAYKEHIQSKMNQLARIVELYPKAQDIVETIVRAKQENQELKKRIEALEKEKSKFQKNTLVADAESRNGLSVIVKNLGKIQGGLLKSIAHELSSEANDRVIILGGFYDDKATLVIALSKPVLELLDSDANNAIRVASAEINGGGGGQKFLAMAGGTNKEGLDRALQIANETLLSK